MSQNESFSPSSVEHALLLLSSLQTAKTSHQTLDFCLEYLPEKCGVKSELRRLELTNRFPIISARCTIQKTHNSTFNMYLVDERKRVVGRKEEMQMRDVSHIMTIKALAKLRSAPKKKQLVGSSIKPDFKLVTKAFKALLLLSLPMYTTSFANVIEKINYLWNHKNISINIMNMLHEFKTVRLFNKNKRII